MPLRQKRDCHNEDATGASYMLYIKINPKQGGQTNKQTMHDPENGNKYRTYRLKSRNRRRRALVLMMICVMY